MRCIEGDIEIPRLARLTGLFQELEREIDIGDRCVEVILRHLPRFTIEPKCLVALEVVAGSAEVAEVPIESEVGRFTLQVPLAGHRGEVTAASQGLGRGDRVCKRRIPRRDAILPGEQRHPRRMALGSVVEL